MKRRLRDDRASLASQAAPEGGALGRPGALGGCPSQSPPVLFHRSVQPQSVCASLPMCAWQIPTRPDFHLRGPHLQTLLAKFFLLFGGFCSVRGMQAGAAQLVQEARVKGRDRCLSRLPGLILSLFLDARDWKSVSSEPQSLPLPRGGDIRDNVR